MPNNPPSVTGLTGDRRVYLPGSGALAVDVGSNALVSDPDAHGFVVRRVGLGFSNPLFTLEVPDGSGRMFVVEKTGRIRILDPETGAIASTPFLDISAQVATSGEQGLLGFALAPDYATSRTFYVYLTNLNGDNELRRYTTLAGNPEQADAVTADRILLVPHPTFTNHNGGWIGFGPDGFLYLAIGDGAVSSNAQNINSILGKILRIDPSVDAFPGDPDRDYSIPAGNPFAGATAGADEVWATGLRNPFRASFDPLNGNLLIGDVGQNLIEEIDLIPAGQGGLNFGWDLREGTLQFNGPNSAAFTPPVAEYGHGTGPFQGNSVTGGIVYRGPIAGLTGQYLFADYFNELWSLPAASLVNGTTLPSSAFRLLNTALRPDVGSIETITSLATDAAGNIYITDMFNGGGEVFRVQPSATPNFAGGSLRVSIGEGKVAAEDRLGLATGSGVTLSNGTAVGSLVSVGGVVVGAIAPGGTGSGADDLWILFSSNADAARATSLIRAVTYNNVGAPQTGGARTLIFTLNDGAGTAIGGSDTAVLTSFVSVAFSGAVGNDIFAGNGGPDTFLLQQGGADQAVGGGESDGFYFGASFGAGDSVDGGPGADDQLALRDAYFGTLAAFTGIETLALLSGSDTSFEAAGPPSTYDLISSDSHIAPGGILTVNGNGLGAAENLTFDGAAEADGSFRFFGGLGVNTLIGGSQSDGFFFQSGAFSGNILAAMDRVNGAGGADNQIGLRGDYSAVTEVRAAMVENIQTIALISSLDPRYGASGAPFSYNLRLYDDSVAAGRTLTINGAGLAAAEQLIVSGFSGVAGSLRLFGGAGSDDLAGGNGDDVFFGGLGVDNLSGRSGNDRYVYTDVAQTSIFATDTIRNFGNGDKVDVAAVDANSGLAGDQDFTFIGSAAFTGVAGQLRIHDPSSNPDDFAVEADINGDGAADLLIYLIVDPGFTPTADSFLGLA